MDNILLVDIGNSSVKWSVLDPATNMYSLDMLQKQYPQEVAKDYFIQCWSDIEKPKKVIVSCVAAMPVWLAIDEASQCLWNIKPERIAPVKNDYGIINAYTQPSELGSDRWCALIGAFHVTDSDVVVIDCGTAITIDVVTKLGQHLGGYILPGLRMMKNSLGLQTAQITVTNNFAEKVSFMPENNTSECVNSAVHLAAVSFIEKVINQQLKRTSDLNCLLTGGDASSIAEYLNNQCVIMPNLVLRGLAYIAKHESLHINN